MIKSAGFHLELSQFMDLDVHISRQSTPGSVRLLRLQFSVFVAYLTLLPAQLRVRWSFPQLYPFHYRMAFAFWSLSYPLVDIIFSWGTLLPLTTYRWPLPCYSKFQIFYPWIGICSLLYFVFVCKEGTIGLAMFRTWYNLMDQLRDRWSLALIVQYSGLLGFQLRVRWSLFHWINSGIGGLWP
jgi:hypothetical protein